MTYVNDPAPGERDGILYVLAGEPITVDAYASAIGGAVGARNFFWDLLGGVGYAFNDRYAAFAGYRVLKVDYASGNFLYKFVQHGPVMGLNIRF